MRSLIYSLMARRGGFEVERERENFLLCFQGNGKRGFMGGMEAHMQYFSRALRCA
jgi:hypothetical protein